MRLLRLPPGATARLVRGYAGSASNPKSELGHEVEHDVDVESESQAESSTSAQRRLWPAPPAPSSSSPSSSNKSKSKSKPTRLTLKDDPSTAVKAKRRRSPNALALVRAQKLAQAMQDIEPPSNASIPLPTLNSLKAAREAQTAQGAPTVEDLEAKRPVRGPLPIEHRRYPVQYQRLFDTLDNAFVATQLLRLAREVGVKVPRARGKGVAIRGIMASWGWEPPISKEVLEARRKAEELSQERLERDWELGQGEMWLIMRDGEGLRSIMEQGVRFSIPTAGPGEATATATVMSASRKGGRRVLRGSGTEGSLAEMDALITERRDVSQRPRVTTMLDKSGYEANDLKRP